MKHIRAGQLWTLHFDLKPRDMSMVTKAGEPVIPEGKYSMSVGGGRPNTGAATVTGTFEVKGTNKLP